MFQITHLFINSFDEKEKLEERNHKNSFEYLPSAKEVSYGMLCPEEYCCFLTIKLSKNTSDLFAAENALVDGPFIRILAGVNRVLSKHEEWEKISISYKKELEENTADDIVVHAAFIPDTQKDITNDELERFIFELEEEFGLNHSSDKTISPLTEKEDEIEKAPEPIGEKAIDEIQQEKENSISNEQKEQKNTEDLWDFLLNNGDIISYVPEKPLKLSKDSEETPSIEPDFMSEETVIPENITSEYLKLKEILSFDNQDVSEKRKQQAEAKKNKNVPFLNVIDTYVPDFNVNELSDENPTYEIYEEDAFVKTTASKEKLNKSFMQAMDYFTGVSHTAYVRVQKGEITQENFLNDVHTYIQKNLSIPEEDMDYFVNRLKRALFSYYVLTPAIKDKNITDIKILNADRIIVKVKGKQYTASNLKFIDNKDYLTFIEALIYRNKIVVNSPILVFTDKDFDEDYILRFNLTLQQINSSGLPCLHIRKVPKKKTTITDLIRDEMMDEKIAGYLLDKIRTSKGICFSGPSASGKTTLQNACVDYIPKDESILCIQESEEMFSYTHPDAMFQHMLKDVKGNPLIGLSELGQNGLLCDSKYFIIGEIKGGEARDLLRASNTGHKCWCTVHAQSAKETLTRLADYVKYGSDYSLDEAMRMLKDLEVIVYIENYKIQEIQEISGYDEEKKCIIYTSVYKRNYEG